MKRNLYTALIFVLIGILISCGKSSNDNDRKTEPADKTIFVFMPYSGENGSLYYNFLTNISDMEKSIKQNGGMGNTRLIVFVAKDRQNANLIDISFDGKKCIRDTIARYNSPSYLTVDGRTALFNQVKACAPAKNYAMIVGCHGEGWLPIESTQRKATTRFFGGASSDYQIEISDFAESIANAGIKLQFILFDDCYLSCAEVAYDLRNITDYVIASTSEIMAYGMPYQQIFHYLMLPNPDYASVCSEFKDFYQSYDMPYGTIGVTNCKYLDEMAALMNNINANHTLAESDLEKIQDLDVEHFTPTVYFDFGDYVKYLCNNDPKTYNTFVDLINKMVPYKACTERIYSYSGRKAIKVNAFSGITISDPSENSRVVESKKATNWWKATHY